MNVHQQIIHAALMATLLSMGGAALAEPSATGAPPKSQVDTPGSATGSDTIRSTTPPGGASASMPAWSMDDAPPAAGLRGDAASQPDEDKASGAGKSKKHKVGSKAKAKHNQGSASNADTDPVDPHGAYERGGGASSPR